MIRAVLVARTIQHARLYATQREWSAGQWVYAGPMAGNAARGLSCEVIAVDYPVSAWPDQLVHDVLPVYLARDTGVHEVTFGSSTINPPFRWTGFLPSSTPLGSTTLGELHQGIRTDRERQEHADRNANRDRYAALTTPAERHLHRPLFSYAHSVRVHPDVAWALRSLLDASRVGPDAVIRLAGLPVVADAAQLPGGWAIDWRHPSPQPVPAP